jgi:hypothetical protein
LAGVGEGGDIFGANNNLAMVWAVRDLAGKAENRGKTRIHGFEVRKVASASFKFEPASDRSEILDIPEMGHWIEESFIIKHLYVRKAAEMVLASHLEPN